jgi:hypothetical protein
MHGTAQHQKIDATAPTIRDLNAVFEAWLDIPSSREGRAEKKKQFHMMGQLRKTTRESSGTTNIERLNMKRIISVCGTQLKLLPALRDSLAVTLVGAHVAPRRTRAKPATRDPRLKGSQAHEQAKPPVPLFGLPFVPAFFG